MTQTRDHFPPEYYTKRDPSDDDLFYAQPRMVAHIDDSAIAYLMDVYRRVLPPAGRYLDLMSSRYSHIPPELQPAFVHATGMNAAELRANPALSDFVVQNLNKNQTLPFSDADFDAAMCCVSVQYLEKPVEVFAEVRRTLKPGAPFVVSFSNRCFPTKAMAIWLNSSDEQHIDLVTQYMTLAGFTDIETAIRQGNPMLAMFGAGGDPLYAITGYA